MKFLKKIIAMKDPFHQFMGGGGRARKLIELYDTSSATRHEGFSDRYEISREEIFRKKAKDAGFKTFEIDALLDIIDLDPEDPKIPEILKSYSN